MVKDSLYMVRSNYTSEGLLESVSIRDTFRSLSGNVLAL